MKGISIIFLVLFLSFSGIVQAGEDENEPAKYEKYDHGVIGKPGDAAENMVLDFEKNRKMKSSGNIVHVEGTDDYLGKSIEELSAQVSKLEAKLSETENRVSKLEAKLRGI